MKQHLNVEEAFVQIMQTADGRALAQACFYDWDVVAACQRFTEGEEWLAVSKIISTYKLVGRALDLGAGNGIGSYALAKLGFRVESVEPDPSNLVGYGALRRMIQETDLPIMHHHSCGESLGFASNTFDLVYARQVLHHAADLKKMLCEVARVLKSDGILIASREHVIDDQDSLELFLKNHPLQGYTGGEFAYTTDEYSSAISEAGLKLEKSLGPWDSVINFHPVSKEQFQNRMFAYAISRFYGLGVFLPKVRAWRNRYKRLLSSSDKRPGRMYTFIARKNC